MPVPKPHADESQSDFMSRCMGNDTMKEDFPDEEQRVAVCMTQWRDRNKDAAAERIAVASAFVVEKTRAAPSPSDDPLEFVMSDGSIDRMGDIIEPAGWNLEHFSRNPIALFNHRSDFVVGQWHDVRVDPNGAKGGQLRGRLKLLTPVSDRQREVHAAAQAGVLRAVSVGFRAERANIKPLEDSAVGGIRFLKTELVECSLVSIPANPNALAVAKSLGLSREATALIFGVRAVEGDRHRASGTSGVRAGNPPVRRIPMNLAERIERTQDRLVALRDELNRHLDEHDDPDEAALGLTDELNRRIAAVTRELEGYRASEVALGENSDPVTRTRSQAIVPQRQPILSPEGRPFALPAKKLEPIDYMVRAATIAVYAHVFKLAPEIVRQRYYGDDVTTKAVADLYLRAATVPADTVTPAWAQVLVQTLHAEFMPSLMPNSVYSPLSALGQRYSFGRNGVISIPTRSATPTIAGSFIGEGAPIPVRQGAFVAVTLTPKKMAVISTMTREISEHSIPALEMLIRDAIQEDTGVSIDVILLDANAATVIRPPGLRNGVSVTPPTVGGGLAALVGDMTNLSQALITATSGNLRRPAWLMNPTAGTAISLMTNGLGLFPFREEINTGRLNRWPVIESSTVAADMLILVDAADFASVTGDDPRFDVSDQATIHMEDTTPLAIASVGTPNTVAAPLRSLWQTDSLGIRMILPMNWALRRAGVVAWTQPITWI